MSAAPMQSNGREFVDKAGLCRMLGWERLRLDRALLKDPKFPIEERGTNGKPWRFDVSAVRAHLGLPASGELSGPALHRLEATAASRLKDANAALAEDKLKRTRGELVDAELMRTVLTTGLARMGKTLDGLPDTIVKQLGLSDDCGPAIRQLIDEARTALVQDLRELMTDPLG